MGVLYELKWYIKAKLPENPNASVDEKFVLSLYKCKRKERKSIEKWLYNNYSHIKGIDYDVPETGTNEYLIKKIKESALINSIKNT